MKKFLSHSLYLTLLVSLQLWALGFSPIKASASTSIFGDNFSGTPPFNTWSQSDSKWSIGSDGGNKYAKTEGKTYDSSTAILRKSVSTSGKTNIRIEFDYKIPTQGEENPNGLESGDYVKLEWSSNGSSWPPSNVLRSFTDGDETNNWIHVAFDLPSSADDLASFQFRFRAHLDSGNDKFFIDNVSVTSNEPGDICPNVDGVQTENDGTCADAVCSEDGGTWNTETQSCDMPLVCDPEVNLIQNGSFEAPEVATSQSWWDVFASGTPNLVWGVDWFSGSATFGDKTRPEVANLELQRPGAIPGWNASEGNQYSELDVDWGGPSDSGTGEPASVKISQTIPTISGKNYQLSFDFSARPQTGSAQNKLGVLVNGSAIDGSPFVADGSATSSVDWTSHVFNFTGTGDSVEIAFRDEGSPDSLGTLLDNVKLYCQNEIPSPCTFYDQTFFSGIDDQVDGHDAALTWTHPAWVATSTDAKWIWSDATVQNPTEDEVKVFTKTFSISGIPQSAMISVASDNTVKVVVNGHEIASTTAEANYASFTDYTIDPSYLNMGSNTMEITVHNWALSGSNSESNPAGVIYALYVSSKFCPGDGEPNNPETSKIHIKKYLDGAPATNENSGGAEFGIHIEGNNYASDSVLGPENYEMTPEKEFDNGNNNIYVRENTGEESNVLPHGSECSEGKYRLVGFTEGDSWQMAENSDATTTDEAHLSNIDKDKYVIVWNETCPAEPPPLVCGENEHIENNSCVPNDDEGDGNPPPSSQGTPLPGGHRHNITSQFSGGQVLGASTETPFCEPYLKSFIKFGGQNDPEEVKKLQTFLNQFFETNIPVTGFYGTTTLEWVKKFQSHENDAVLTPWSIAGHPTNGPTGYVYKTTQRWINILKCPDTVGNSPIPSLP